jgi:PEP-CTERM motif
MAWDFRWEHDTRLPNASIFDFKGGSSLKIRIAFVLCLALAAIPALAQSTVYSNGPINGSTDAWTINSGFVVSDTFSVPTGGATVGGLAFGAWEFPGDVLESAEVEITSSEFGGTVYTDQVVNFTQSGCSANQYGFNVCTETGSLGSAVNLAAGTYWLNLDNAVVNDGDPIYWDENSGPSSASENSVGTIPSESFTVLGTTTTTTSGTVPEPSSMLLFGSGVVGLVGWLRRKML